ncbi:hypothetical protein KAI32_03805 [Candidatus Pacearchaeota archaeon]|nr:hypothetical protein [Candidatus Pacearchaeota archaeon]
MQSKINAYLVTLIGILLILPLAGVTALGTLMEGIIGWVIAIIVLIIGIVGIVKNSK